MGLSDLSQVTFDSVDATKSENEKQGDHLLSPGLQRFPHGCTPLILPSGNSWWKTSNQTSKQIDNDGEVRNNGVPERFKLFPPFLTKRILFVSPRDIQGTRVLARRVQLFADILALLRNVVAYIQNQIHHIIRNRKDRDAFTPMVFCAGIRIAFILADAPEGPEHSAYFAAGLRHSPAPWQRKKVPMQPKTTNTTTGYSDKDIKSSMTTLLFTVPLDFHKLVAGLLKNMAEGLGAPVLPSVFAHGHVGQMESNLDVGGGVDVCNTLQARPR